MLGVGWAGERELTRRCRSREVLAELATGGAEGFGVLRFVAVFGPIERRRAVRVLRIHICPGVDEEREDLGIFCSGGRVDRRPD